jgi:NDP-sugar pyrophosphorylase family protein
MNGDVLTWMALGDLVDFCLAHRAPSTLCVNEHRFQVPQGVAEVEGVRMTALRVKPIFRWLANAGVYCLDDNVLARVPAQGPYDLPELLAALPATARWSGPI